jgi:uroporphyrinogen decarboxylase
MRESGWPTELGDVVLEGRAPEARSRTEALLASGVAPETILEQALIPAMAEAGRRFEDQRFFLPELMFAARAMKEALTLIRPLLSDRGVPPQGRVVIGTVSGDLHDIGKNIVAAMLEGGGFAVHDLGTNVSPAAFAQAAREHHADIVGLSALLTTTMPVMREVVAELGRTGIRERVKVMVGGAPLTERFAREIGADAYADTAAQAVRTARALLALDAGASEPAPTDPDSTASTPETAAPPVAPAAGKARETPPVTAPPRHPRPAAARSSGDTNAPASPRELVKRTLDFQAPHRLPRQIWVLPWARARHPLELAAIEDAFPQDITTVPVPCSEPAPGGGNAYEAGIFVDAWGCEFENLQAGTIGQVKNPQLHDWTEADKVRFPRERLAVDEEEVRAFCAGTDRYVLAGTCPRPFERLQFLRGSENLYLDLNRPPAELLSFMERLHAFYVEELTLWARTDVDALVFMDDWGSQRSLLVAPELWRELFRPMYAEYVSIAHAHGKHVFMHSDGWITEIIPDLIDIGLDALNSQVFCMGVEELGRRFAGELTFWGELDRQQLLPRATTQEIADAARSMRAAFHRSGGFIAQLEFGPGARPENIHAYFASLAAGDA